MKCIIAWCFLSFNSGICELEHYVNQFKSVQSLNSPSESVIDDADTEEIINYSFTSKRRKIDVYRAQIEMKTIHLVANYEQYLFTDISNDWTVCLNRVLIYNELFEFGKAFCGRRSSALTPVPKGGTFHPPPTLHAIFLQFQRILLRS